MLYRSPWILLAKWNVIYWSLAKQHAAPRQLLALAVHANSGALSVCFNHHDNNLWIACVDGIHVYDLQGVRVQHITTRPTQSIAFGANREVYCLRSTVDVEGEISVFADTDWSRPLKTLCTNAPDNGGWHRPVQIALHPSTGELLLTDFGDHCIRAFDVKQGQWLRQWGRLSAAPKWSSAYRRPGEADGEVYGPFGVAVNADGDICVTEWYNDRVQIFDSKGKYLRKFSTKKPRGIDFDRNGNFVLTHVDDKPLEYYISVHRPDGTLITQWGQHGRTSGQFSKPRSVCVDSENRIVVLDGDNNVVLVFAFD